MATILLVEDDEYIRRMLVLRLSRHNHLVKTATNGKTGVKRAQELSPDLLLMDMHMPVMDGHQAVQILRANGYDKLIVAITASVTLSEKEAAQAAGCDYLISKPIGTDFESTINDILRGNVA